MTACQGCNLFHLNSIPHPTADTAHTQSYISGLVRKLGQCFPSTAAFDPALITIFTLTRDYLFQLALSIIIAGGHEPLPAAGAELGDDLRVEGGLPRPQARPQHPHRDQRPPGPAQHQVDHRQEDQLNLVLTLKQRKVKRKLSWKQFPLFSPLAIKSTERR